MPVSLPSISKRANAILAEIKGVKAQYGVSQWEETFLNNVAKLSWGSDRQLETLAGIEKKVFGKSDFERIKAEHKGEVFAYED
jgi:hypothetical protein